MEKVKGKKFKVVGPNGDIFIRINCRKKAFKNLPTPFNKWKPGDFVRDLDKDHFKLFGVGECVDSDCPQGCNKMAIWGEKPGEKLSLWCPIVAKNFKIVTNPTAKKSTKTKSRPDIGVVRFF